MFLKTLSQQGRFPNLRSEFPKMSSAFMMLPSVLRELERFTIASSAEGIVLKNGHVGRAFNLSHHDPQKLVNATRMLADAVEAWAKVPPVIGEQACSSREGRPLWPDSSAACGHHHGSRKA